MGMCVCILMRQSVVILLLTLVLQRGQDSDVFAHHHFILYTSVTLDSVWQYFSRVVAVQSLKYLFTGLLWCDMTGVTGCSIG